jgi:hypothetical protein
MRVTDDRYIRDRQRFDLAVRMVRHEARTCTIRLWTGLTGDRIRKLIRSYVAAQGATITRHRGKSPSQSAFFVRNLKTRRQTAALAGQFAMLGLLHGPGSDAHTGGTTAALRWGWLFCRAYETYLALYQPHCISFEHAWYLLRVLKRSAELRPQSCPVCQGFMVADTLRARGGVCTSARVRCRRRTSSGRCWAHSRSAPAAAPGGWRAAAAARRMPRPRPPRLEGPGSRRAGGTEASFRSGTLAA